MFTLSRMRLIWISELFQITGLRKLFFDVSIHCGFKCSEAFLKSLWSRMAIGEEISDRQGIFDGSEKVNGSQKGANKFVASSLLMGADERTISRFGLNEKCTCKTCSICSRTA